MGVSLSINDIKSVTNDMARYKNLDYAGHSFSFLKRRLSHVFLQLKVKRLNQFSERLSEESFREGIRYHMAVNVTEMFRDPGFWRSLRQTVFPLLKEKQWSVWFPDTPSGEEVYSFIILLAEDGLLENVKIFSQHASETKCKEIADGFIDHKNAELNYNNYKRLEEADKFEEYFLEGPGSWTFKKDLLVNCNFIARSVVDSEIDESFDFIVFRNTCINYTSQSREEMLEKIVSHLNPGGFLALGVKEALPSSLESQFKPVDQKESIYKKLC
ncbi:CheR family methyltransferase [Marinilabilia rubra]|uniref:Chemotaxis protein CheR n=1 Tax=Marinilabilia rubra TaxID=2162893 RepID=A0A2U2B8P0_9BACT|nr:CheR family methyltransferase [Marinilabilia rubra]PWD99404.1 chemotaxis protein CheR [Marinilabilia rubra]